MKGKITHFSAFILTLLAVFTIFPKTAWAQDLAPDSCPSSSSTSCTQNPYSCNAGIPGTINKMEIDTPSPAIQAESESIDEQSVATNSAQITTAVPIGATLNPDLIFDLINEHRAGIGLPLFQKDANLCSIAQSRTTQMPAEVTNGNLHAGLYARNLPYWITENMKYGGNEQETVDWWLHSPIHRAAIESNNKYACGACIGNTCDMLFTSYTPK